MTQQNQTLTRSNLKSTTSDSSLDHESSPKNDSSRAKSKLADTTPQNDSKKDYPMVLKSQVVQLSDLAMRSCGGVHNIYVQRFSESIDALVVDLAEIDRNIIIDYASTQFDYYAIGEEDPQYLTQDDFCRHGLDKDCCPCGCGEY